MTTLLIVRDASGKTLRKCDELCYDARLPHCDCCCCGRNHGVGHDQAVKNLKDFDFAALLLYLPFHHVRQLYLVPVGRPSDLHQTAFPWEP
jgi:hypothetical protein